MPTFIHGKDTRVWLDQYEVSDFFQSVDTTGDIDAVETTVFGQDDKQFIVGLPSGQVSLSGYFEDTTDIDASASSQTLDTFLASTLGSSSTYVLSTMHGSWAAGTKGRIFQGRVSGYTNNAAVSDVVSVNLDMMSDGTATRSAWILNNPDTAVTATSYTGTTVTTGLTTTGGAVGTLQIMSNTWSGNVALKIQTNISSTWTDLITFDTVSAGTEGAWFKASSAGATVDSQLRVIGTLTGSGSLSFITALARLAE